MTENNNEHQNEVQLISKDDGVWSHYWDGYLHRMPRSFVFPKKLTLLRSWLSWHLPDIAQKIWPYKLSKADNIEHIPRGFKYLYKIRLVMEVIISKFNSIPSVKSTYLNGRQNIRTLSDVFQKVKNVFVQANPKPINNCVEQLS